MRSDAGPPAARALPDPTNKPVPVPCQCALQDSTCRHTYRAANRNHLQVSALQLPREASVRRCSSRALDVESAAATITGMKLEALCGFHDVGIGVALEAVLEVLPSALIVLRRESIHRVVIGATARASDALFVAAIAGEVGHLMEGRHDREELLASSGKVRR